MGICWSDPPPPPPPVSSYPLRPCISCGAWTQKPTGDAYCTLCLQKTGFVTPPSAPPLYPPPTYVVGYPQPQQYAYYQARPPQQQMGTGTAMVGGFVLGAIVEDLLDPTE